MKAQRITGDEDGGSGEEEIGSVILLILLYNLTYGF